MPDIQSKALPSYHPDAYLADVGGVYQWKANSEDIHVKDFFASGSLLQATASSTSGSNVIAVASGAAGDAFLAKARINYGIYLAGAGNQGIATALIGIISAINGRNLTLVTIQNGATPKNATTTVTNTLLQFDDTDAIRAAIASGYVNGGYGAWTNLGKDRYRANKDFDANNAIFSPPYFPSTGSPAFFGVKGSYRIVSGYGGRSRAGAAIITDLIGSGVRPSVFAARAYTDATGEDYTNQFNFMNCHTKDVIVETAVNSNLCSFSFGNATNYIWEQCAAEIAGISAFLINEPLGTSIGVAMPQTNNNTESKMVGGYIFGQAKAILTGEHTIFDYPTIFRCKTALVVEKGFRPNIGTMCIEQCTTYIEFAGQNTVELIINNERFGANSANASWYNGVRYGDVLDTLNVGHGTIHFKFTIGNVGDSDFEKFSVTGCENVKLFNVFKPHNEDSPAASTTTSGTGLDSAFNFVTNSVVERKLLKPRTVTVGAGDADDFTTSGDLNGRFSDRFSSGSPYVVFQEVPLAPGVFIVNSNKVKSVGGKPIFLLDTNKTDNRMYFLRGYTEGAIMIARAVNADNWVGVFVDASGTTCEYWRRTAGAAPAMVSASAVPTGSFNGVGIAGTTMTAYFSDGSTRIFNGVTDHAAGELTGARSGGYLELDFLDIV
jgi:hypothetical protein